MGAMDLESLTPEQMDYLEGLLKGRLAELKLSLYEPYRFQMEFHSAGKTARERLLMAANQIGKSQGNAAEIAMHLTGQYPDWWDGRVWEHEVHGWAAGVTAETNRDALQRLLLGRDKPYGTGMIPRDAIVDVTMKRGVSDAVDKVTVRHRCGNLSSLTFKSYDQGREKFQAESLDFVALDEEPSEEIYSECLTRINARSGALWLTFTPLMGMSQVVRRYLSDTPPPRSAVIRATIDDAEHYTPEQRAEIIASYLPHERDARTKGIPIMGSGLVFPVAESVISVPAFQIPDYWPRIVGIDFGWDHPFAAVWLAWDRDGDVVYVTDCFKVREQTPILHAASIKPKGAWMPVAWPHDGIQHDKGSGEQLSKQYKDQGLQMLKDRATFPDGTFGLEAGVLMMLDRMQSHRLKVFSHLTDWFTEFREYHRKDGQIVKERDDIMSATRYGLMMLRHAKVKPSTSQAVVSGYVYSSAGL